MAARRSIIAFEKWVNREIANIETELYGLKLEQESVDRKRAVQEVKLDTLRQVKARLQPVEEAKVDVVVEAVSGEAAEGNADGAPAEVQPALV